MLPPYRLTVAPRRLFSAWFKREWPRIVGIFGIALVGCARAHNETPSVATSVPHAALTARGDASAEPSAPLASPAPSGAELTHCRSTADCDDGLRCCTNSIGDTPQNFCQPDCAEHEACVPGGPATCPGALACHAVPNIRSGGECLAVAPSVECNGTRCSGARPGCCHSLAQHRERCIAVTPGRDAPADPGCEPGPDKAVILCRSRADCGGERCCTHGFYPLTACESACATGIDVCATIDDCPPFGGPPTGCAPDPDGPPSVKICRYAGSEPAPGP